MSLTLQGRTALAAAGGGGTSDADLTAIAALTSTGLLARTASDTWAHRSLTAPAAGFTITNPAGVAGDPTFVLAHDLAALEGLGSTGLAVRSAANTWVQRSIAGTAPIVSTNGDGVSGNPTLSVTAADASNPGSIAAADYQKLVTYAHGTQTIGIDIETGTYGGSSAPTTSSNRDVISRVWSNTADGEGRYIIRPLPGRTGGDVVFRLVTTLGASGSAGLEIAWKLQTGAVGIGDTLASALPNSQTVYMDVSAQTAHVVTAFDITLTSTWFDQTKRQAFILTRLGSSDARDDYAGTSFHLHAIDLIYTGWGPIASPSAPT